MRKPYFLTGATCILFHPKFLLPTLLTLAITGSAFKSFGLTYTWNQTGTASWTVPANWTPTRSTPATTDVLIFSNGATTTVTNVPTETIEQIIVNNGTTVNLQAGVAANILSITGSAGADLAVAGGAALNNTGTNAMAIKILTGATASITGNMTFSGASHTLDAADAGAIVFNSPAVFTQDAGCTAAVFTTTGTASAVVFGSGTTFLSKAGVTPFGLPKPNSKVVFQTGNLYKVQQGGLFDVQNSRVYADLEVDFVGFHNTIISTGGFTTDNFTMTNGYANLLLDGPDVVIKGNLTIAAGGNLQFNGYTSPAADTIRFNGTAHQTISNAGTLVFGNASAIVIDNAAGININNNITFSGPVKFLSGIVTIPNTQVLSFGPLATVIAFSNSSFADGKVAKIGNAAFTFPIGKTNCGPSGTVKGSAALGISNFIGGAATDQFTAEYIRGSAYSLGAISVAGLHHISACDYWTFTRDVGTSTVDITLYWNDPINNCNPSLAYIDNPSTLTVAHNNNTVGSTWNNIGTAGATTGSSTAGTVTWPVTQSPTFGAFAIGSINFLNPLPITVSYFTGSRQNSGNALNWKISGIAEPVTGTLERSVDGQHFNSIYSFTADALRSEQPFNYTDANPPVGVSYYRLAIANAAGKINYSKEVSLQNSVDGFTIASITPNPVGNAVFTLQVTAAAPLAATIVITDIAGRKLKMQTALLSPGINNIAIDPASLAAGTYTISAISGSRKPVSVRFVKE